MVTIKVFSDYVCPYCFLQETPLNEAIEGKDVLVEWMPFELRPEPTPTLKPEGDYLQTTWKNSVYPYAEQLGVEIKLPTVSPQPYTHLAFEGYQYAKENGQGNAYTDRLFRAFFQEDLDIGDVSILTNLAGEVGLDQTAFRDALEKRTYKDAHQEALKEAEKRNITSVPSMQIGDRLLVGLHSKEQIADIIEQESKPKLSFGDGAVCGPDGCFI